MNTVATLSLIVNLSPLRPPLTGIGHYTREILIRLMQDPSIADIQGFYYHRWLDKHEIEKLLYPEHSVGGSGGSKLGKIPFIRPLYRSLLRWIHRPKMASLTNYVYWETNYVPIAFDGATVVTIYDLSFIRYPNFHPSERVKTFNRALPGAVARAKGVVTISDFSSREISTVFPSSVGKITIIPPGTSDDFHPRGASEIEPVRRKYALPEKYWLSVATIEPRKNLKNLLLAYARLSLDVRRQFPLVLVGTPGWLSDDLEPLISPLEEDNTVLRLGYVPQEDLPLIYCGAGALLYLSLYEGYGMPVAEAVRSGIPVMTSEVSSMPEVGGNRAWYADPDSVDSIVSAMRAMMASPDSLSPFVSSHRASPFIQSWADSARQFRNLFAQVAQS